MASIDDVQDITPRVQYTALAAQTVFAYPFPIFVDADIVVDVDGVLQVLTTDYTVSGAGNETGGNVTFVVAPGVDTVVTIYRDISIERSTDFQQNGPWSSTSFNDELDKITLILQELENKVGRSIRFPISSLSTNAEAEMSPIDTFFGKHLRISSTGILEPVTVTASSVVTNANVISLADVGLNYAANDVELAFAELRDNYKIVITDQDENMQTTLQTANALSGFSLVPLGLYKVEAYIIYTQNVGNFKWAFAATSGSFATTKHGNYRAISLTSSDAKEGHIVLDVTEEITTMTDTEQVGLHIVGTLKASGATVAEFQFAQETSSGNDTSLLAGSWVTMDLIEESV